MKRRNFIKNMSLSGAGALLLNGLSVNALANLGGLRNIITSSTNDKVLVLIQLHGGNDGLNTLIPINQYSEYYNLRNNIAIPESGNRKYLPLDSSVGSNKQLGLHPDMGAFRSLYDNGKAAIVQSVGYDNMNGSHFRSRDIWLMGGDYNENFGSGWMGRYLDNLNPSYPDGYPSTQNPDPLAMEIGSKISLAFHRENGIPVAISLEDPEKFYDLISKVGVKPIVDDFDSKYGQELEYIMEVEEKSNQYAERLQTVFDLGRNVADYPEKYPFSAPADKSQNKLSAQLKTIARMLSGGCQTKVFLAKIDGFDTHANQIQAGNTTMGEHAALLHNLFSAINAFQTDLAALGLEDRVMTVTFSEFGRRASSNGSLGTDHGTAAPMFVFGKQVNPGIIGENPDLNNLTNDNNLIHQHDYRQVFATLLKDWMNASPESIEAAKFSEYVTDDQILPLIRGGVASSNEIFEQRYYLYDCTPNPATEYISIKYRIPRSELVTLTIKNDQGRIIETKVVEHEKGGEYEFRMELDTVPDGIYFYTLKAGGYEKIKRFLKI